jgi:hypothetical protein
MTRATLSLDDRRHGTENAYKHFGCRCEACSLAHSGHMRTYRSKAAGKAYLNAHTAEMQFIAEKMPTSFNHPNGCWLWDSKGLIPVGKARSIIYSATTGLVPPNLDTSKGVRQRMSFPCRPECARPEHMRIWSFETGPSTAFDLTRKQREIITALSYLPADVCWTFPPQTFGITPIDYLRRATTAILTNRMETEPTTTTCQILHCVNPDHSISVKQKVKQDKDAVRAARAIAAGTGPKKQKKSPRQDMYAPILDQPLTNAEIQMRIVEFKKRITTELKAHVDYAACLSDKIVYEHASHAARAVEIWASLSLNSVHHARAYKCDKCRYWHLTSSKSWSAAKNSTTIRRSLKA